jgi:hypothetical protein
MRIRTDWSPFRSCRWHLYGQEGVHLGCLNCSWTGRASSDVSGKVGQEIQLANIILLSSKGETGGDK